MNYANNGYRGGIPMQEIYANSKDEAIEKFEEMLGDGGLQTFHDVAFETIKKMTFNAIEIES